jgi:hypothetical protein
MTSTVGAVALAIVSVLGLVMWILNRRNHATPEQQIDDRRAEMDSIHREITMARARGDDAHAESLLRRLGSFHQLQNPRPNSAVDSPGTAGQRGDRNAATGHNDLSA